MSEVNSLDHLKRLAAAYQSSPVLRLHFKTEAERTVTKQGGDRAQLKEKNTCHFCHSRGPIKLKSSKVKKGLQKVTQNGPKWPKIRAVCCLCGKPYGDLKPLVEGRPKKAEIKGDTPAPEVALEPKVPKDPEPQVPKNPTENRMKKKSKKDVNAGLVIPKKFNNAKLAKFLQKSDSGKKQDRLLHMFK